MKKLRSPRVEYSRRLYSFVSFSSSQYFNFQVNVSFKKENSDKVLYLGNHFWARRYFVSTVGLDEYMIIKHVKHQDKEEKIAEEKQQKFDF